MSRNNPKRLRLTGSGGSSQPQQVEVQQQEPYVPTEEKNNIFSKSYARVLDLVCEGEIEGFAYPSGHTITNPAHWPMGVYVNETPLMNSDGTMNFKGVRVALNYGTQTQRAINGFGMSMETLSSGQTVTKNAPVVLAITNPEVDVVAVTVRFDGLIEQDKVKGDISGSAVWYDVQVSHNSGTYTYLGTFLVQGASSQPFTRTTWHNLPKWPSGNPLYGADTWQIKVTRESDDSKDRYITNSFAFEYMVTMSDVGFRYPNSALVACELNAKGFTSVPVRGFHMKLLRVKVPSNYNPKTRLYNVLPDGTIADAGHPGTVVPGAPATDPYRQVWDGSFKVAWTDNPAWCFYDLLTNKRYGLGNHITYCDKWSLYKIGTYCDELVDDGQGDTEPRFTCNIYIQSREEAYKVVQDFASVFRGIVYWATGTLVPVQDRPRSAIATYTNANVENGIFSYSGTAKKARHTVALVRWNDPDNFFRPKYEYVEDFDGMLQYGYNQTDVAAFACTSRGQARRLGRWILLSELHETDTVSFRTALEGVYLRPGDTFKVYDNDRAGSKQGGRITNISSDRLTITFDRPVDFPAGASTIHLCRPTSYVPPDPTQADPNSNTRTPQLISITLSFGAPAPQSLTLNLVSALDTYVDVGSVFIVETPALVAQTFRCIGATEISPTVYEVTGLKYYESKFDAVESGLTLEEPSITDINKVPGKIDDPTGIKIDTYSQFSSTGGLVNKLRVVWDDASQDSQVQAWRIEWRFSNSGAFTSAGNVTSPKFELPYTLPGVYDFGVTALSSNGTASNTVYLSYTVTQQNPLEQYKITGLELVGKNGLGQANDTTFAAKDAMLQWRLNSPSTTQEIAVELAGGADPGGVDPYLQDYEVTIWDITTGIKVFTEITKDPKFIYTYKKNVESIGTNGIPRNQFRVEVRGRTKFAEVSPAASIVVQNAAPSTPTQFSATPLMRSVNLEWKNPTDIDLEYTRVYENTVSSFATATVVANVYGDRFYRTNLPLGVQFYYWVAAVDTFGNQSAPTVPISLMAGTVQNADINDFAITATKTFLNTIVLDGDTWADNNSNGVIAAGYITWNAHTVVYRGNKYDITGGATNFKYVYWTGGNTYTVSNTNPSLNDGQFMVATNISGIHDLAWNAIANQVVGSAYIQDLAVTNAKISDLAADKITAGSVTGQTIILADNPSTLVSSKLKSQNYSAGVSGFQIDSAGNAELNNAVVRGLLDASKINNNSITVNSAYPLNAVKPVASTAVFILNTVFGATTNGYSTNYYRGGSASWDTTAYTGGTALAQTIASYVDGVNGMFFGMGIADQNTGSGFVSTRNRLGTNTVLRFYFWLHATVEGAGDLSIVYRVFPYSVFATMASTPGSTTTYPWVLNTGPDGTTNVGLSADGGLPRFGFIELAIPATSVVQFTLSPITAGGVISAAKDQVANARMIILAVNP